MINAVLGGEIERSVACSVCQGSSRIREPILDISVPVPESAAEVSLDSLLAGAFEPESLDGENQYFCDTCQKAQDAQRTSECHFLRCR
jgi:ubiquitin C-terminal hydrolase